MWLQGRRKSTDGRGQALSISVDGGLGLGKGAAMPRKLRLEYPGACYHVINRGNYRAHLFQAEGAKAAFEACLFEACAKSQWVLHAFGERQKGVRL